MSAYEIILRAHYSHSMCYGPLPTKLFISENILTKLKEELLLTMIKDESITENKIAGVQFYRVIEPDVCVFA